LDWHQTSLSQCLPDIAYGVWGMDVGDNAAKKSFAELIETHFVTLLIHPQLLTWPLLLRINIHHATKTL
jgi:hypothetical protein